MALGELSANFLGATIELRAKAAFVNTEDGATHGWTEGSGAIWSPDTIRQLELLRSAMESDLARMHMEDAQPIQRGKSEERSPSGLAEHLSASGPRDAPQT